MIKSNTSVKNPHLLILILQDNIVPHFYHIFLQQTLYTKIGLPFSYTYSFNWLALEFQYILLTSEYTY